MSTFAPRHNGAKKVMRGLRERYQNSHRATPTGIWHAQGHERVARAHVRFFHKTVRAPRTMNIENVKNDVLPKVSATFLSRSTKYCARHEKWARGIRSAAPATRNHHHVQNQKWRQFHKTRLSNLSKCIHVHQTLRLPPATQNDFHPRLPTL